MNLPSEVPSPKNDAPKTWRVGTLVYTSGALTVLFLWLIWGDFAWQLKERSVMPVVQVLLKKFDASDLLTGFLLATVPAAIGLIVGPIASYRSDRHRGRWGRRIPFLLIPTPIVVITMAMMAGSPWLGARLHEALGGLSPGLNACILAVIGISWGLFEIATLTANAIFGALVNDVVPQEMLGRFFGIFRAVSLLAGILFNKYIFGLSDTHYTEIFLGMAAVYGIGFTVMCLKVKEGAYPPPPAPEPGHQAGPLQAVSTYFRETYTHSFYILTGCVVALAPLIFLPVNLFSVYYAESVGMSRQSYGEHVANGYTISLILAYLLGILADKFHPVRMGMVSLVLYLGVAVWAAIFARDPRNFGIAFTAHIVLSGMYFTTTASLPQRLFPQDRFAQFFSAFGILGSIASMLMPLILGAALDWNGRHYQATFGWGAALSILALAAMTLLYIRFMRLGGPKGYVPPAV